MSAQSSKSPCWPARVSPNGRYIVDTKGKPWFWLGDTAWAMITRCTARQAALYMRDRAAKGFSVLQTVLAWSDGSGHEEKQPWPNRAGQRPWANGDPARPNERYFAWVDELLSIAERHELVLGLLPVWGYFVNDSGTLNVSNARTYGRWLGNRFRDRPNVIWINGGDRIPWGSGRSYIDVYRELGRGLREGSGGRQLITYHPCGWSSSSDYFHNDEWLDMNMIETWSKWNHTHAAVQSDVLRQPAKPVIMGEGSYEDGHYWHGLTTPLLVRRQAWWTHMAGGFHTYGQSALWRMEPGWEKGLKAPGAAQMGVFRTLAESRPWWQATAYQGLFEHGVSSGRTLNAAIRACDGSWAMAYLASQCHVVLRLDRILKRRVKLTLACPWDLKLTVDLGTHETGTRGSDRFYRWTERCVDVPVHWDDAVLFMDGCD